MIQLPRVLSFHIVSCTGVNGILPSRLPSLALQSYLSQVFCSGTLCSKEEPGSPLALLMFTTGNYTKLIFVGKRVFGNEALSAKWKQAVQEI